MQRSLVWFLLRLFITFVVSVCSNSQGQALFERAEYAAALESFREAHRAAVAIEIPDASMAQLLNNLTLCCQKLGNWKDAVDYCERSLLLRRNYQSDTHTEYIKCSNHLANCYYHRKNYAEAQRIYEDVLSTLTSKLGESHADTMRAMHNSGLMAYYCGKKEIAVRLLKGCLEKREAVLGTLV